MSRDKNIMPLHSVREYTCAKNVVAMLEDDLRDTRDQADKLHTRTELWQLRERIFMFEIQRLSTHL